MTQKKKPTYRSRTHNKKRRTNAKTTRGGTTSRRSTPQRKPRSASTSRSKRSRPTRQEIRLNLQQKLLIVGIAIVFVTLLIVLSLLSPNQGELTSALSGLMWRAFGWGGAIVPLITGGIGLYLVLWGMEQAPQLPAYRLLGFATLFLVFEAFASMITLLRDNGLNDVWQIAQAQLGGGYVGGLFVYALGAALGNVGAIVTFVVFGILGAVLASGVTRQDVGQFLHELAAMRQAVPATAEREIPVNGRSRNGRPSSVRGGTSGQATQPSLPLDAPSVSPEPETPPPARATTASPPAPSVAREEPQNGRSRRKSRPQSPSPETATPDPIFLGRQTRGVSWKLPILADMLEAGADHELNSTSIREQVEVIEHTLESFGAPATIVEINQGPTITQFGVEPNFIEMRNGKRTKVKVGKIASLADDLALALAAHSIRIEAPVPGKGYVGIEVPNVSKAMVSLRDVLESAEFQKIAKKSPLAIGLGQNVSGQPIAADLAAMPHLLIAGTTGSGKSVCVNSIIAGLLLLNTPDVLKLVMVDPKRVELTGYNGIPHLAAPVVVEMDRVIGTMQWALREMDHRYKLFSEMGARNITDYNKKIGRNKDKEKLPYIVIIIDELADLMMLAPEDTERAVTRLAQMARATGIHMVIATQRPSVDVVTGLIKANFPARIAFAVASSTDSRVILDSTGAERLLGQGDMLFQSPDAAAPVRLQGTFVGDAELSKLIEYWRTARRFNLIPAHESVTQRPADEPPGVTPLPPAVRDAQERGAQERGAQERTAQEQGGQAAASRETETAVSPSPMPAAEAEDPSADTISTPAPPPQVNLRAKAQPEERQRPLWEELQALEEEAAAAAEYEDDMLPEAIALVRQLNKASTSLLQRRFRIGYTRAARLMDIMEEQGIIGPPTGTSKAREVLPWDGLGTDTATDDAANS